MLAIAPSQLSLETRYESLSAASISQSANLKFTMKHRSWTIWEATPSRDTEQVSSLALEQAVASRNTPYLKQQNLPLKIVAV